MPDENREIEFKRYAIHPYFGPPIEEDRVKGRKFSYMLTIPFPLEQDQMKIILQMVSEMSDKHPLDKTRGIELMIPKDDWWRGNR